MQKRGLKKRVWIILTAIIAVGALTGLSVLTAVCVCAGIEYVPEPSDCIIVLGARVWPDGRMSDSLLYRCESALAAWQAGIAPSIIVCGGQGDDEPMAEAQAMADWLVANGVPADCVLLETESTDTRENLKNARVIMTENGFETAAVCTSDYHLKRALWIARDAGIEASGISAPSPRRPTTLVLGRLRETVSWVLYFLRMI